MIVIGVSGKIGHGKDTIGDHLIRRYGFTRVRFADCLKEEVLARLSRTVAAIARLNGLYAGPGETHEEWLRRITFEVKPAGIRELLQEYGTEVRRTDDALYWIKKWHAKITALSLHRKDLRIVSPDMRFDNEAEAVGGMGGLRLKVYRPGQPVGSTHVSEAFVDTWTEWDQEFINDSSVAALEDQVDRWLDARAVLQAR